MAPVNWANSDADIEANLKWIEDRHQVSGKPFHICPNTHCSREWHGEPKGTPGENHINRSGSFGYYCPGSHKYGADGRPVE